MIIYYVLAALFFIIFIIVVIFWDKDIEEYSNIFGDNTEFDLSCANNSITRYINDNPFTTIALPCSKKNLLTAENYFRTKYLDLPLNTYETPIMERNYYY